MKRINSDQIFTYLLGALIIVMCFLTAGVCFSIVDMCSLSQAISEYMCGCVLIALMGGLMYAYAIYESNK